MGGIAAGALLFALGWKAAAPHLFSGGAAASDSYAIAKDTVLNRAAAVFSAEYAGKWGVYLAAVFFWFSPFQLGMWLTPALKSRAWAAAGVPAEIRFFYFAALFYFAGYFLIGGLNHGFPRYQMGIWPLAVFLSVFGCREALRRFLSADTGRSSVLVCLAALAGVLLLPDPLRLLNTGLKEALLAGGGLWRTVAGLGAVAAFYLALFAAVSRRGGAAKAAIVCALSYCLITGVSQLRAGYLTSYEYGTSGKAELAADLRASVPPEASIFATPGLLYYIRPGKAPEFGTSAWNSAGAIKTLLAERRPEAVLLSPGSNALWQFRLFRSDPELTAFLDENYTGGKTGNILVWRRKARLEKN
jgi:hypothetical protein